VGIIGSEVADAYTSHRIIAHGGVEDNPFLPEPKWANTLTIIGGGIIYAILVKHLYDHGHPTLAKVLGLGNIGVEGLMVQHNLNQPPFK